jgi:hypothetical protein
MREIALSTITTMLAIYTAILVIVWQHVADQYTPKLLPTFLRHIALVPLLGFAILLLFSGGLVLHPLQNFFAGFAPQKRIYVSSLVGDSIAFLFLLVSVGIVVLASYNLAKCVANGTKIISWLHNEEDQQIALQEALQSSVQRGDRRVTIAILHMAISGKLSAQKTFLTWLEEHQDLLTNSWFIRELLLRLFFTTFNTAEANTYTDTIYLLLKRTMDDEQFLLAQEIIRSTLDAFIHTSDLEQAHAILLERMGFAIWKIGEANAYALREVRIPRQLTNIQNFFIDNMRSILSHIVEINSQSTMQFFCSALGELALVTREGKLRGPFLNIIHESLEAGFSSHLFSLETIQKLVSHLGYIQMHPDMYEEATQERIEGLVIELCAIFVELGGEGKILHQLLEEGALLARRNKQGGLSAHLHSWLKPESYNTVAMALNFSNFEYQPITLNDWNNKW